MQLTVLLNVHKHNLTNGTMNVTNDIWGTMKRVVPPVTANKESGLEYLREQMFSLLSISIIYIGSFILAFSLTASLWHKLYLVSLVDVLFGIPLFIAATSRRLAFPTRVYLVLGVFYLIGITMFLLLGPMGAGWVWLFAFVCAASLLLDFRHALYACLLSYLSVILLGILIYYRVELLSPYFRQYDLTAWVVNASNFIGLSLFICLSFSFLIKSVSRNLLHLRQVRFLLQSNRDELLKLKLKAEESDRLKSLFLANMSHEIRSPMNAILGFTGLLKRQEVPREKAVEYLSIIDDRGQVLLKLINDILDISRIDAQELKLVSEEVNVPELVKRLWTSFRDNPSYSSSHIEFRLNIPSNEELVVFTDPVRLQQILSNLIHNAVKFTHVGYVQLGYESDENGIVFYVKDTGIGIPHEKAQVIFDRFTQADHLHQHSGTGLGLAISKALVEKMGGRIWLCSEEGIGSTFYFNLPFLLPVN